MLIGSIFISVPKHFWAFGYHFPLQFINKVDGQDFKTRIISDFCTVDFIARESFVIFQHIHELNET